MGGRELAVSLLVLLALGSLCGSSTSTGVKRSRRGVVDAALSAGNRGPKNYDGLPRERAMGASVAFVGERENSGGGTQEEHVRTDGLPHTYDEAARLLNASDILLAGGFGTDDPMGYNDAMELESISEQMKGERGFDRESAERMRSFTITHRTAAAAAVLNTQARLGILEDAKGFALEGKTDAALEMSRLGKLGKPLSVATMHAPSIIGEDLGLRVGASIPPIEADPRPYASEMLIEDFYTRDKSYEDVVAEEVAMREGVEYVTRTPFTQPSERIRGDWVVPTNISHHPNPYWDGSHPIYNESYHFTEDQFFLRNRHVTGIEDVNLENDPVQAACARFREDMVGVDNIWDLKKPCCEWPFITCMNRRNVWRLELRMPFKRHNIRLDVFPMLRHLEMVGQDLSNGLPESLFELSTLTTLSLKRNNLKTLDGRLGHLTHLQSLTIAENPLTDESFEGDLRAFDLFSFVYRGFGKSPGVPPCPEFSEKNPIVKSIIGELSIEHCNNIDVLPRALMKVQGLKSLSFISSSLKSTQNIGYAKSIVAAVMTNNEFTELSEDVFDLKNLVSLILQNNELVRLPEYESSDHLAVPFPHLQIFSVGFNHLRELPRWVYACKRLNVLDVSDNMIGYLSDKIGRLESLRSLLVHGNPIDSIPPSIMATSLNRFEIDSKAMKWSRSPRRSDYRSNKHRITDNVVHVGSRSVMSQSFSASGRSNVIRVLENAAENNEFSIERAVHEGWDDRVDRRRRLGFKECKLRTLSKESTILQLRTVTYELGHSTDINLSYDELRHNSSAVTMQWRPKRVNVVDSFIIRDCKCANHHYFVGGKCLLCPENAVCSNGGVWCNPHYYLQIDGDGVNTCVPCPKGASCRDNMLKTDPGFWRRTESSTTVLQCLNPDSCVSDLECKEGHGGVMCGSCVEGYFDAGKRDCQPCTSSIAIGVYVLGSIGAGVLVLVIILVQGEMWMSRWEASSGSMQHSGLLSVTYGKTAMSFLQVVNVFVKTYALDWPSAVVVFSNIFAMVNMDVFKTMAFECLISSYNYYWVLSVMISLPFCVIILLCVIYCSAAGMKYALKGMGSHASFNLKELRFKLERAFLLILYILYVPISSTSLGFFHCVETDLNEYALANDLAVICYNDTYKTFTPIAFVSIAIFTIGMPLSILVYTMWYKKNLHRFSHAHVKRAGVLFFPYRRKYAWWESLEMVRKVAITSLVTPFATSSKLQALISMGICIFFIVIQMMVQPFSAQLENDIQTLHLCMIFLTLLSGVLVYSDVPSSFLTWYTVVIVTLNSVVVLAFVIQITLVTLRYVHSLLMGLLRPGSGVVVNASECDAENV